MGRKHRGFLTAVGEHIPGLKPGSVVAPSARTRVRAYRRNNDNSKDDAWVGRMFWFPTRRPIRRAKDGEPGVWEIGRAHV